MTLDDLLKGHTSFNEKLRLHNVEILVKFLDYALNKKTQKKMTLNDL